MVGRKGWWCTALAWIKQAPKDSLQGSKAIKMTDCQTQDKVKLKPIVICCEIKLVLFSWHKPQQYKFQNWSLAIAVYKKYSNETPI